MKKIRSGHDIRITDYLVEPGTLLDALGPSLLELKTARRLPVLYVRRGWLHGSHLRVTACGYEGPTAEADDAAVRDWATTAVDVATTLASTRQTSKPDPAAYLQRAEQLARWENKQPPFLPLFDHADLRIDPASVPAGWNAALSRANDQIMSRYLRPVLETVKVPAAQRLSTLACIMGTLARAHSLGVGVGTLPFRSHVEGVSSAAGSRADLRSIYGERYEADAALFNDALDAPLSDPLLLQWHAAFSYAVGVAEGLVAAGCIDDGELASAAGSMEMPMGPGAGSSFIDEMVRSKVTIDPPYLHVAYRIVLNTLYSTLACFGITALQRYYLCFGLAEAADRRLGETANDRLRRLAAHNGPLQDSAVPMLQGASR